MNARSSHSLSFVARIALLSTLLVTIPPGRASAQTAPSTTSTSPANSALQDQADHGDAGAQYRLAKRMLSLNPTPAETQTALDYLRASVAQSNPNAQFYLGYLYEHGKFLPQDYALAFQNYEAATRVHYPVAENNLASLYQHGQGVPKNLGKAYEWYLASAQHGDPVGQLNLANLYFGGDGVRRDIKQAVYWLRLSADAGLPEAQNNLAYFYFYGVELPRDYDEAARLIRLAAGKNLPGAQTSLGYLYEQGKGVRLDYVAAYSWYTRASLNGDHSGETHRRRLAQIMTPNQIQQAKAILNPSSPATAVSATVASGDPEPAAVTSAYSLLNH